MSPRAAASSPPASHVAYDAPCAAYDVSWTQRSRPQDRGQAASDCIRWLCRRRGESRNAGCAMPLELSTREQIFWACLEELAERSSGAARAEKLHHAAKTTRELCDELSLEVIALQPVMDYDGIIDEREHRDYIDEIKLRLEVSAVRRVREGCQLTRARGGSSQESLERASCSSLRRSEQTRESAATTRRSSLIYGRSL